MGKAQVESTRAGNLSSDQLKTQIEQTRAEMDRTVDELAEQLRLQHLVDRFLGQFGSADGSNRMAGMAKSAGKWVLSKISHHPLPIAVIGAGVTWLIIETKRGKREVSREPEIQYQPEQISGVYAMSTEPGFEKSTSPGIREEMSPGIGSAGTAESCETGVSETASRARQRLSETSGKVSEWSRERLGRLGRKGSEFRAAASERAHRLQSKMHMDQARETMGRTRERVSEILDEYPLAVGISALAVGLVVGLAIPTSRGERRQFGPKASRWRERARERAEQLMERGKEVVQSTAEAAKEEARRQGLTVEGIKESAKEIVREVGASAEREGMTPEGMVEKVEAVAERATETAKEEIEREQNRPI